MTNLLFKKTIAFKSLIACFVTLLCITFSTVSNAQLTGTKSVPSLNYPTIKVAVDSLNLYGVGGGGVIFDIAAGYTETLTATLSITASGTLANPIVFQKSGAGVNPLITAYTGGTSTPATVGAPLDGIIRLIGSDWITFDGISLQENAANTSGTAFMEYGLAFYKTSGTNGCNNNTIKNCIITLNKNNTAAGTTETDPGSVCIFGANATFNNPSVALTVTAASGTNSNNKFYSNTFQSCFSGISLRGFADALAPFSFYDQANDIGGNSLATGNTIIDFGGGSSGTSSVTSNGIKTANANAANISYNTIRSYTGAALACVANINGILASSPNAALTTINNNTVTVQIGTNSSFLVALGIDCSNGSVVSAGVVNMNNNTIINCNVAPGTNLGNNGPMTGLRVGSSPAIVNMNSNLIYGDTMFNVGTFTGIIYSGTNLSALVNINSNQIYNIHKVNNNPAAAGGGNNLIGIAAGYAQTTVNNNVIHDFTIINIVNTMACKISAFNITTPATGTSMSVTNNQVYNLFTTGTSTSTSQTVTNGIEFAGNTGVGSSNLTISGNTFYNFNSTNTALTGAGALLRGMEVSTALAINVFNNKMYDFTCTGLTSVIIGYRVLAGQNLNLYNNYIGNFFTPTATAATAAAAEQIIGISDEGTTANQNHNFYYNTIFLTGTSTGTNFGSSVVKTNIIPNTILRNNICINNTTPKGLGLSVAHRRTNTSLTTYLSSSNNNIFYATTPLSVAKNIYYDGTNSDLTLAAYKTRVAGRDNASATELTTFLSTVGANSNFLHVDPTVATAAESGGANIGGITTDFDNDIRQGNLGYLGSGGAPDIGADEFGGIVNDLASPAITSGTVLGACGTGNRIISGVVITDATGVPIAGGLVPRIYYKKNVGGAYFSQPGTLTSGTATNGTWDFTIIAADMGGLTNTDSVGFYFIAQDVVGTPNISSVPFGAVATNVNTVTTPPTIVNYYKVLNSLSGTYTVGSGGNYATITAAVAAYNTSCLSGAVVFSLTDANYATETFPIIINANPFASATNTLTIKPASGNVSIQANTSTHVFALFAADYVTIEGSASPVANTVCPLVRSTRNLTIQNNNQASTQNCVIFVASNGFDGATNNKIINCNIVGGANAIPWVFTNTGIGFGTGPVLTGFSSGTASLGFGNNNNTVENNNISKVAYGIISQGFSFAIKNQNNAYRLNEMSGTGVNGIFRYGILLGFENNASVVGNTIKNLIGQSGGVDVVAINLGNNNGIAMNGFGTNEVTNYVVSNNVIDSIQSFGTIGAQSAVGIATSNSPSGVISLGTNLISNNMISRVAANSNGTNDVSCGLFIGNQVGSTMQIYNNTVNLNSDGYATNFATNVALFVGGSGVIPQVDIKNNILVNSIRLGVGNNFVMGIQVPGNAGNYVNLLSDNNDMFVSNGGGFYNSIGVIGVGATPTIYPGTNNFPTLAAWQAQTGRDANSKNVMPAFVSPSNPHLVNNAPVNVTLNGTAVVLASVPVDIDCESRTGANSPDIGADEFTLPPIDIAFDAIKPTANSTCHSANEPIIVTIRNTGSTTIDMAIDTIFVSTTYSGTISGTSIDTVYAGTLAPNTTIDVTLEPTINTTANGSYTFTTAITPIAGESSTINNNNVTSISINNTSVAVTAGIFNNNLCLGYSTPITAAATFGTLSYSFAWSPSAGLNSTTGATVIAAPGSTTTYTVTVTDGCGNSATATALVNISIPGIQSAPSNTRCGVGTVTLTGVPNPGSSLNWYTTATGNAIAGTGNTFITPSIAATTTFYVSATSGNVPYYVGLTDLSPANGAVTFGSGAGRGQMITVNKPGAITGCIVYPSNAATITAAMVGGFTRPIQICLRQRGSFVNIATAGPFSFTLGQLGTPVQLSFNLPISATGDYQLVYDTIGNGYAQSAVGLAQYSFSYTGTYPLYTADSSLVMPGGAFASNNATVQLTTYNAFWNVQYTTYCESARQPVVAGFTPTPPMTISPNRAICIGDTASISVTSNIPDYDNYVWTTSGTTSVPFYTDPACTNLYVTGSSATTIYYIGGAASAVTFICNSSNALLCQNVANTTITTLPALTSVSTNTYGICGSGSAILAITPLTGYAAGSIFWESSTDSSSWNPVAGSTATLTTPVLAQKTYFRVSIRNSNNAVCSQLGLDPIYVYNPAIISAPGVTRCGVGSVNLVANVSLGATAAWYTTPTSQPSLLVGNSVTSPVIAATTTYYVAAREGSSTYGVGVPAASATYGTVFVFNQISGAVTPDKPLWITVVKPGVLEKLTVYPTAAGNMTINLRLRGSDVDILVAGPFTITAGQIGTAVELPVNMAFTAPGLYQITNIGLAGAVLSPYNGAAGTYPFSTADGSFLIVGSSNNSTSVSAPTSGYNAMFNLKYNTACESARVPVIVTVTPPPAFTTNVVIDTVCGQTPKMINVTSTLSNYTTYTWAPAAGLYTNAAGTIPYIPGANEDTVYSNPDSTTVYVATATETLSGCVDTNKIIVTPIYLMPALATNANLTDLCGTGSVLLNVSGVYNSSIATYQWESSPDNSNWTPVLGGTAISLLTPILTQSTYFHCIVKCTGSPIGNSPSLLINVNNPLVVSTVADTVCGSGSMTLHATPSTGAVINWFSVPTAGIPIGNGNTFNTPVINTTTTYYAEANTGNYTEPVGIANPNLGGGVNLFPGRGLRFSTTKQLTINSVTVNCIDNSTSFIDVALQDNLGNELASTGLISGLPFGATVIPLNFVVPVGTDFRLVVKSGGGGFFSQSNPVTYPMNSFSGAISITGGFTSTGVIAPGVYYLFYGITITAGCYSPRVPVEAFVKQTPVINITPSSSVICPGDVVTMHAASTNDPYYSYQWSNGPTGANFTVAPTSTQTYTIIGTDISGGINNGCQKIQTRTINVNPAVVAYTAPSLLYSCGGGSVPITVTSAPVTGIVIAGTGTTFPSTQTSFPAPYGASFESSKHQMLITASELSASGMAFGSELRSLAFSVLQVDSTVVLKAFTIKIAATNQTSLTTWTTTGFTQVYGPVDYDPDSISNEHLFSSPFAWDGVSNIVVETCFSNDPTNSGVFQTSNARMNRTTTAYTSVLYGNVNDFDVCPIYPSFNSSTERPNMVLAYTNTADFTWSPSAGLNVTTGTSVIASPAASTVYTVTATNFFGCTSTKSVTVNLITPPAPKIVEHDSSLCSNNGGYYLHVIDTGLYSAGYPAGTYFEWVDWTGATDGLDSFLVNSTYPYKVVVTLPSTYGSCSDTSNTVNLDFSQAQAPVPLATSDSVKCKGTSTGNAFVNVLVGASPMINYAWYNSSNVLLRNVTTVFADDTLKNIPVGSYYVIVTNNVGTTAISCGEIAYVDVYEPDELAVTEVHVNNVCYQPTGVNVDVTVTGGSLAYNYAWSNGETTEDLTGVHAGTYTVVVTDYHGCVATRSVVVIEPTALATNAIVTSVTCKNAKDGTVTLAVTGGVSPYAYQWNNLSTASSRSGLAPGTYTVTVTDHNGCQLTESYTITQSATLLANNVQKTNVKCGGKCTGTITSIATGGTAPYKYHWSTGETTQTINNLCAGSYTLTIEDANHCIKTVVVPITQNTPMVLIVAPSGLTQATASVAGGVAPYAYYWNTVPPQTTQTAVVLYPGNTYKVRVTDSKGCSKTGTVYMPLPKMEAPSNAINNLELSVFPNPTTGMITLNFNNYPGILKYTLRVYDITGREVYSKIANKDEGLMGYDYDFSELSKGIYSLSIQTEMGNKTIKIVIQ